MNKTDRELWEGSVGDSKGELKGISIAETFKGESLTHFPSKQLEKGTRRKKPSY